MHQKQAHAREGTPGGTGERRVLVWRETVLGRSETFIANQVAFTRSWDARLAGLEHQVNDFGVVPDFVAPALHSDELVRYIKTFDLVHAHFGPDAIGIVPAAKRAGVPLVATFHGFDATVRHLYVAPSRRKGLRELFAYATCLVAVSGYIRDKLIALGAPREKVVVHHIGIPMPDFDADDIPRDGILFVGRLVDKKGCVDLLRAATRLQRVPIVVIGEGPQRTRLERFAKSRNLDVEFRGSCPPSEVDSAMRSSALLCCPSRRALNGDAEGLPIAPLEAGARFLPVVATTASGIPESILDGRTGLLAPERRPRQLARRLGALLDDPDQRRVFAAAARQHIAENFDVQKQSMRLGAIYDAAVENAVLAR